METRSNRTHGGNFEAVVTGGAGFIGSHLTDTLTELGYQVHIIDDLRTGDKRNIGSGSAKLHLKDIRDPSTQDLIAEISPNIIYHLAAQASVSVSVKDPQLDARINIAGGINILEGARRCASIPKVVFVSTGGAIYGEPDESQMPVSETLSPVPLSPYGASKLALENYLPVYSHLYQLPYAIARPANIYGPRQNPHGEAGVIAIFTKAMLNEERVQIFGDGTFERDFLYVSDFVAGLIALGQGEAPGPYNISSGKCVSVNDIFSMISDSIGYADDPTYRPVRAGDIRKISLDNARAERELRWTPAVTLQEGLDKTAEWFRAQQ